MGIAPWMIALTLLLAPEGASPETVDQLDQRVDVGGFHLRARVLGEGSPAVVFDAGGGDGLDSWRGVPTAVAAATRVVLYDRAGHGGSDPGPLPRTADRVAAELRALLRGLEISPPYILVGHSLGGIHLRAFAHQYPEEVAGLVFLDVTTEGMHQSLGTEEGRKQYEAQLEALEPGVQAEFHSLWHNIQALPTYRPPAVPVVVLTAMARQEIPPEMRQEAAAQGLTEERLEELRQLKLRLHQELAARFPDARHVLAEESGHYIHWDEPQRVTGEILGLLERLRDASPGNP